MNTPQTRRSNLPGYGEALATATPQATIVAIDDSPTVRAVIEACLSRCGYRVATFGDGLQAMGAWARGDVDVPDLLLLDIGLPKMNGYELARILRSKPDFADTILVVLSGHDGVFSRVRGRAVGASAYITKPFRVHHLVDLVTTLLARRARDLRPPR
jgi:DNA-binding response OmpR family regulator